MGNRANVHFVDEDIHVYLHWNGGVESVAAFLQHTSDLMGDRTGDPFYFTARFIQVVGTFFGGNTSLGLSNMYTDGKSYKVKVGKTVTVAQNGDYQELSDVVDSVKNDSYWTDADGMSIMETLQAQTPALTMSKAYTVIVLDEGEYTTVKIDSYSWDKTEIKEKKALGSCSFSDDAKVIAIIEGWKPVNIMEKDVDIKN